MFEIPHSRVLNSLSNCEPGQDEGDLTRLDWLMALETTNRGSNFLNNPAINLLKETLPIQFLPPIDFCHGTSGAVWLMFEALKTAYLYDKLEELRLRQADRVTSLFPLSSTMWSLAAQNSMILGHKLDVINVRWHAYSATSGVEPWQDFHHNLTHSKVPTLVAFEVTEPSGGAAIWSFLLPIACNNCFNSASFVILPSPQSSGAGVPSLKMAFPHAKMVSVGPTSVAFEMVHRELQQTMAVHFSKGNSETSVDIRVTWVEDKRERNRHTTKYQRINPRYFLTAADK